MYSLKAKTKPSSSVCNEFSGFTLIELLVVISIISMLSSIVLASISQVRQKGIQAGALQFASSNYHAIGSEAWAMFDFNNNADTLPKDLSINNFRTFVTGTYATVNTTPSGNGYSFNAGNSTTIKNGFMLVTNSSYDESDINEACTDYHPGSPTSCLPDDFTVSVWTYLTSNLPLSFTYMIDSGRSVANNIYGVRLSYKYDSNGTYYLYYGSCGYTIAKPNTLQWNNFTYSYDSNLNKETLYINGKKITSCDKDLVRTDVNGNAESNRYAIGAQLPITLGTSLTGSFFPGYIDDVMIYGQSLSAEKVSRLYADGLKTHLFARVTDAM